MDAPTRIQETEGGGGPENVVQVSRKHRKYTIGIMGLQVPSTVYVYTILYKLTTIQKKSKVCNMSTPGEVLFITQAGCSLWL